MSSTTSSVEKHTCVICPTCMAEIIEANKDLDGQEAIFCDGECCQAWYHRWCAGLTKSKVEEQVGSQNPFFCQSCVIHKQNKEIASLHDSINSLKSDLANLRALFNAQLTQLNGYKCHTNPASLTDAATKAEPHPGDGSSELPHKLSSNSPFLPISRPSHKPPLLSQSTSSKPPFLIRKETVGYARLSIAIVFHLNSIPALSRFRGGSRGDLLGSNELPFLQDSPVLVTQQI